MKKIFYGFLVAFFFCQGAIFAFETNTRTDNTSFDASLKNTFSENNASFFGPIPITTDCSASCDYRLILQDGSSNAWDGASIDITVNGQKTKYTMKSGVALDTISLGTAKGQTVKVDISYHHAKEEEHGWAIVTPYGDSVAWGGFINDPVTGTTPWDVLQSQSFKVDQCASCCDVKTVSGTRTPENETATARTFDVCAEIDNANFDTIQVELDGISIVSTANPAFIPCPIVPEATVMNIPTTCGSTVDATFPLPDYVDCGIEVSEIVALVELHDAKGNLIASEQIDLESLEEVDFSDLAIGAYTVKATYAYVDADSDSTKVTFEAGQINVLPQELYGGLVCNDKINVSLEFNPNDNCEYVLQPDDLLENISACAIDNPELFDIILTDAYGNHYDGVVDGSMVGKKIQFQIYTVGSTNFCWGEINVEDKQGLNIICEDATIYCTNPILEQEDLQLTDNKSIAKLTADYQELIAYDKDCHYGEKINSITIHTTEKAAVAVAFYANSTLVYELSLEGKNSYDITAEHYAKAGKDVDGVFKIKSSASDKAASISVRRGVAFEAMLDVNSCSEALTPEIISTSRVAGDCSGDLWKSGTIVRTIRVANKNGASASCTQTIHIKTPTFEDFELPTQDATIDCKDIDIDVTNFTAEETAKYITPAYLLEKLDDPAFAAPTFGCHPIKPTDYSLCNIAYTYSDKVFSSCKGKKIIRTWNVMNWCTRVSVKHTQAILIDDFTAPTLKEEFDGEVIKIGTDIVECASDFKLDHLYVDDCSEVVTVEATYYIQDTKTGTTSQKTVDALNDNITGLPLGTHNIYLVAADACGNTSDVDTIQVHVEDSSFPVAVMNKQINVTLGNHGEAIVRPRDVDEGSFDNCGIAYMEVRRLGGCLGNSAFSKEGAIFKCCDADTQVKIEFRVTDLDGNQSTIWAYVLIENGTPIKLDCPDDITVTCADLDRGALAANDTKYGAPTLIDNCGSNLIDYKMIDSTDACDGKIIREWTYDDNSSKTEPVTCRQVITVTPSNDWKVTFPANVTTDCLDELPGTHSVIIDQSGCEKILVKCDTLKLNEGTACKSYQITYTVINDCIYNPGSKNDYSVDDATGEKLGDNMYRAGDDGAIRYTQIISIEDNQKPVITCPSQDLFREIGTDCSAKFGMTATASDNCANSLRLRSSVDANGNGIFFETADINSNTLSIAGELPTGTYTAIFTAEDECGNRTSCTHDFTLEDAKAPTPICYAGLTTAIMPEGGMVEIWASDFLKDATDNCTDKESVMNSVKAKIDLPGHEFSDTLRIDCQIISSSPVVNIIVRVYDEDGNHGDCRTMVVVQDNFNTCPQVASSAVAVAGKITDVQSREITNVDVTLSNGATYNTSEAGGFAFTDLPINQSYTVEATKTDELTNGISTLDITLMVRHILGKESLKSAEAMIAADLDNNKAISASDMLLLRQAILRKIDAFPSNDSWKFIDANHTFTSVENALNENFAQGVNLENLNGHTLSADLRGIKMGDLSGDATPNHETTVQPRTGKTLGFEMEDAQLKAGQTHNIVVKAADMSAFLGYQFTLEFNEQALEIVDVKGNNLDIDESYFNLEQLASGKLATAYAQADAAQFLKGDALFTIAVRATQDVRLSEALSLSDAITSSVAYVEDTDGIKASNVSIAFNGTKEVAGFELYQNRPNPFNDETFIGFDLPTNQSATLTVYDMSGKVVAAVQGDYAAGYNEITIQAGALNAAGVLYYELATENFSAVKRMIVVK